MIKPIQIMQFWRWPREIKIAVVFWLVIAGWILFATPVEDEGYYTFWAARLLGEAHQHAFFFQKFRPVPSLFYLPFAYIGYHSFVLAHSVIGALGVWLASATGQHFYKNGWIAGVLLACSQAYAVSVATGHTNSDALVVLLGAIYFIAVKKRFWIAGFLIGIMPWIRYEFAIAGLVILGFSIWQFRNWRVFVGASIWPFIYLTAGAIYHQLVFWFVSYPPALGTIEPLSEVNAYVSQGGRFYAALLSGIGYLTPSWALIFFLRWSKLSVYEKLFLVLLGIYLLIMWVFPVFGIFNFDHQPRYWLVFLPYIIYLVTHAIEDETWTFRLKASLLVLFVGLAFSAVIFPGLNVWLAALVFSMGFLIYVLENKYRGNDGRKYGILCLVILVVGLLHFHPAVLELIRVQPAYATSDISYALHWLDEPEKETSTPVFTNSLRLGIRLKHGLGTRKLPVLQMAQYDSIYELYALSNHNVDQYNQLIMRGYVSYYGTAIWPCLLFKKPEILRGKILILEHGYRTFNTYPLSFLETFTMESDRMGGFALRIGREQPLSYQWEQSKFPTTESMLEPLCRDELYEIIEQESRRQ